MIAFALLIASALGLQPLGREAPPVAGTLGRTDTWDDDRLDSTPPSLGVGLGLGGLGAEGGAEGGLGAEGGAEGGLGAEAEGGLGAEGGAPCCQFGLILILLCAVGLAVHTGDGARAVDPPRSAALHGSDPKVLV